MAEQVTENLFKVGKNLKMVKRMMQIPKKLEMMAPEIITLAKLHPKHGAGF